jgi:hypothetical protein
MQMKRGTPGGQSYVDLVRVGGVTAKVAGCATYGKRKPTAAKIFTGVT